MPFAGCAKTHDEAHRAFGKIPLVAMLDDGGIKQRGRLDGIFRGEIGADQQALLRRDVIGVAEQGEGGLIMLVKNGRDLFVPALEFFQHLVQNAIDFGIGESGDAIDDLADCAFRRRDRMAG